MTPFDPGQNEICPSQSITSSARVRMASGAVRPSALAAPANPSEFYVQAEDRAVRVLMAVAGPEAAVHRRRGEREGVRPSARVEW